MKREVFEARIDEEVEWVDGFEVGDEVNFYREFPGRIGEENIGLLILVGIEAPLEHSAGRNDLQVVFENPGSAMERGAKLNDLRADEDWSLILIVGPVMECDFHSHITLLSALS